MKQIILFVIFIFTISSVLTQGSQAIQVNPDQFSWDDVNGVSYLNPVKNQNFPFACNSGWAFSTVGMLESRIKKLRKASSPDITLSTQVLLSCDSYDYGCLGGQPSNALRFISRNNITDETCHSYLARGYTEGQKCTSQTKCQKCNSNGTCKSQANSKIFAIQKYGTLGLEKQMMDEIQNNGPIACGISITNQFKAYSNTTGIFQDKTGAKGPNHYVLLYGWGIQNNTKFWLGRNSWGSSWGQNGNFRIIKGQNNLGIENLCYWGSVVDTWTNDIRNETVPAGQNNMKLSNRITYQLPAFLTSSKSVLTPKFCESSWAFSIIQMFRDRISKRSKGKTTIDFSAQVLLNCGLGQCSSQTDPFEALSYINKYGIPQESCQGYKGERPTKQNCTGFYNCASCSGTAFNPNCTAVSSFKRWKTQDYGTLSGEQSMMNQLNTYGPIVCSIDKNSTAFENYEGGIIKETTLSPKVNHYVEIVGSGSEGGVNYWIGRNFWGTSWGEEGFFRIKRGSNTLGVEKRCFWANIAI